MKKLFISIVAIFLAVSAFSQTITPGPELIVIADPTVRDVYVPPDASIFAPGKVQTAVIIVNYDTQCSGCLSWPVAAKTAFEFAVNIWENTITSTVPIRINAQYKNLGDTNILGQAGAASLTANFVTTDPNYEQDTYYPLALANKMFGSDIFSNLDDINAEFNSTFTNWYFGIDGNTPDTKYDFVSVVLHELAHGLGFSSSARDNGSGTLIYKVGSGSNIYPMIYDRNIVNSSSTRLTNLTSPSTTLTSFLKSNNLFWDGSEATTANGNSNPKIFAP